MTKDERELLESVDRHLADLVIALKELTEVQKRATGQRYPDMPGVIEGTVVAPDWLTGGQQR